MYLHLQEQVTNSPDLPNLNTSKVKEPLDNTKGQVLVKYFNVME